MTALTNRGLALKLAVEHVTDGGQYDLLQDDSAVTDVFNLADKFASWIGGQNSAPTSGEQADAPEETEEPERGANDAVESILAGLDREAVNLGADIVNSARQEVRRLRTLGSFQDVVSTSLRTIDNQATFLGRGASDRLRSIVRSAS